MSEMPPKGNQSGAENINSESDSELDDLSDVDEYDPNNSDGMDTVESYPFGMEGYYDRHPEDRPAD